MEKLILLGCGGHALSVVDSIKSMKTFDIVGILDLPENVGKTIAGIQVIGTDDLLEQIFARGVKKAFITVGSVGNYNPRLKLHRKLKEIGFEIPNIIDPTAIVSKTALLGKGIYIGKGAIVNTLAKIDDFAIINTGSIIEHESKIGAYSHVAPGATICGDVKVGDYTHIGAGTTVIQGRTIGSSAMIGAGSVVIKDIGANSKAYGSPCKIISVS